MKPGIVWSIVLIISLILQSTVFAEINYNGIHADLLLAVVVSSSLLLGKEHGVVIGFFAGLLQDLASGTFVGMNVLSKMLIGYIFGMAEQKVFKEHFLLPLISVSIATIGNSFITATIMLLLGYRFDLLNNMIYMMFPLLVYNLILAFPIHKLIYRIHTLLKE